MPRVAHLIEQYNHTIADFVRDSDRTTLKASIFNVPKRTEVTLPCYTRIVPGFFRRVAEHVAPEELGTRMRVLAGRPTSMHIGGVFWQTLLERERRRLVGLEPLPAQETAWVLEWTARVLAAQRIDGSIFPNDDAGWHNRILEPDAVAQPLARVHVLEPQERLDLRYLSASLELYSFMLHGEHRDGIFDHGPYDDGNGRVVVIKDFTDLQSTFLPWATPDVRLPHQAISLVFVLEGSSSPRFNWAGTAEYASDPYEDLRLAGVFSVGDGVAHPLAPEQWRPLGRAAQDAQKDLFLTAVGWPESDKVTYGAWLFANHLQAIPRSLGLDPSINAEMVTTFQELVAAEFAGLDLDEPSPVWGALRHSPPFTPWEELVA